MSISNITLNNNLPSISSAPVSTADTESKTLQTQLAQKQQHLNRISSDSELSSEKKAKERQELEQQIAELNRKLKLLRMEKEEEAEKAKKEQEQKMELLENATERSSQKEARNEDSALQEQDTAPEPIEISAVNVHKLLVASSRLQQTRIQESAVQQKEHTENVLKSEITLDALRGSDTTQKEEKLEALRNTIDIDLEPKRPKHKTFFGTDSDSKIIVSD
ncbi:MAG: hypothetical protein IJY09_00950 [Lachnospiraceae bacterium]|nr:hypothetical protein [Lachnospiraceae bacterium]